MIEKGRGKKYKDMIKRKELLSIVKKYDTEHYKDYSKNEKVNLDRILKGLESIKSLLELGQAEHLNIAYGNKLNQKALSERQYSSMCNCFDEVYNYRYAAAFHNLIELIDNCNDPEEDFTLNELIDISLCVRFIETNLKIAS